METSPLKVLPTARASPSCQEAPGRPRHAQAPRPRARPVLAEDPRVPRGDRGAVPRPQLAGEELDHRRSTKLISTHPGARRRRVHQGHRARDEARADERAREPVPRVAHRLGEPVRRPAPHAVLPARARASCPTTRSSSSTRSTSRTTRPSPGSRTATSTRRSSSRSTRAPSTAASARAATPIGLDTEEVEKVHLRASDERWQRAFEYIASRPELEDIVISGGDAYQLRADADHRDRRGAPRDAEHPAHALRDEGAGGHAAEDPHRRARGSTRSPASSRRGASCTRRSCSTRTSTTRTRSPASPKTR